MAKRYGRNQRRRHRAEIAELQTQIRRSELKYLELRRELQHVQKEALDRLMEKYGLVKRAVEIISEKLGDLLGPELMPHAMLLLKSSRTQRDDSPLVDFSLQERIGESFEVLRGQIKAIDYNVVIR